MRIMLWIPFFSEKMVMKDPGQIALHLAELGHDVGILSYLKDWNKPKSIGKVKLVSPPDKLKKWLPVGLPLIYYVLVHTKPYDCLILYLSGLTTAIPSLLFKILNNHSVCVVKLDSNGILYPYSGYRMKVDSGGNLGNTEQYKHNILTWFFYRVIGELALRIFALSADIIIIESPEARERVLAIHPWLKHKLVVLPNGINFKEFGEIKPIKRNKTIMYVGRVEYAKGVDLLLMAFSRLKDKYLDWNVELIGQVTPWFRSQLEIMWEGRMSRDRVVIHSPIYGEELMERYLSSSIFCFPSRSESFGIVLVEAMCFGCAVISSDVGAARYILNNGHVGLIFENDNLEQLVEGLDKLMGDEALRNKLSEVAKARVRQEFNWETIVNKLDIILRR